MSMIECALALKLLRWTGISKVSTFENTIVEHNDEAYGKTFVMLQRRYNCIRQM